MGIFKRGRDDSPDEGVPADPTPPQAPQGPAWSGRPLNLQQSVSLETIPVFAAQAASAIGNIEGAPITYTVADLDIIDRIADQMHQGGPGSDALAETLFAFGCLVGEIMVRNAGGTWRGFSTEEQQSFGFPVGVSLPNGKVCNPIGKVFKRVENGAEDSLPYFYRVFTEG